jgi:hypothetical protein
MQTQAPELLKKMIAIMKSADANEPRWQAWRDSFNPRVIEYHRYLKGGGLTKKHHFDEGSCYTMVIMLSDRADFEGGNFKTWEADETWCIHDLHQGDCVIIPSYKFYSVETVTEGRRNVIVIETWAGAEGCEDKRPMPGGDILRRGEYGDDGWS